MVMDIRQRNKDLRKTNDFEKTDDLHLVCLLMN